MAKKKAAAKKSAPAKKETPPAKPPKGVRIQYGDLVGVKSALGPAINDLFIVGLDVYTSNDLLDIREAFLKVQSDYDTLVKGIRARVDAEVPMPAEPEKGKTETEIRTQERENIKEIRAQKIQAELEKLWEIEIYIDVKKETVKLVELDKAIKRHNKMAERSAIDPKKPTIEPISFTPHYLAALRPFINFKK